MHHLWTFPYSREWHSLPRRKGHIRATCVTFCVVRDEHSTLRLATFYKDSIINSHWHCLSMHASKRMKHVLPSLLYVSSAFLMFMLQEILTTEVYFLTLITSYIWVNYLRWIKIMKHSVNPNLPHRRFEGSSYFFPPHKRLLNRGQHSFPIVAFAW